MATGIADVDLKTAARDFLNQGPTEFKGAMSDDDTKISFLRVTKPFGRFGNNFYQAMHAVVLAKVLKIHRVLLPSFDSAHPFGYDSEVGCSIEFEKHHNPCGRGLSGAFYVPYGFEKIFSALSPASLSSMLLKASDRLYPNFTGTKREKSKTLAVHIRAGDIFAPGSAANWYVQPPASFYTRAIDDAFTHRGFTFCEIVFEDRSNPAIEVVEAHLRNSGKAFYSGSSDKHSDVTRLILADGLVCSFSSFAEAAALISKSIMTIYSFRVVSSQIDFAPFLQTRLAGIFLERNVDLMMIEDSAINYIAPKTWDNSENQRATIATYPADQLRIFLLTKNCL